MEESGVELAARHMAFRERAGITQVEEAEAAGVSPATVSGIESGKIARPHLRTLIKLAGVLGVTPEELMGQQVPKGSTPRASNWEEAVRNAAEVRLRIRREIDARGDTLTKDDALAHLAAATEARRVLYQSSEEGLMSPLAREEIEKAEGQWIPNPDWEEIQHARKFENWVMNFYRRKGLVWVQYRNDLPETEARTTEDRSEDPEEPSSSEGIAG